MKSKIKITFPGACTSYKSPILIHLWFIFTSASPKHCKSIFSPSTMILLFLITCISSKFLKTAIYITEVQMSKIKSQECKGLCDMFLLRVFQAIIILNRKILHEQTGMALLIPGLCGHFYWGLETSLPLYFRQIKWFDCFLILNVAYNWSELNSQCS